MGYHPYNGVVGAMLRPYYGYHPYNGVVGAMLGPYYGYVDVGCLRYGDRGGRYLLEGALVSQATHTESGVQRLPVWSNDDHLIVACPSWWRIPIVEEDGVNDGFIWVHRVSQHIDYWRHDRHPMEPEILSEMLSAWKKGHVIKFDSASKQPVASPQAKKKNFPRWRR